MGKSSINGLFSFAVITSGSALVLRACSLCEWFPCCWRKTVALSSLDFFIYGWWGNMKRFHPDVDSWTRRWWIGGLAVFNVPIRPNPHFCSLAILDYYAGKHLTPSKNRKKNA